MDSPNLNIKNQLSLISAILVIVFIALGYLGYSYWQLSKENNSLKNNIMELEQTLSVSENNLSIAQQENIFLNEALEAERERVDSLGEEIENALGTVGTLEKLSKTDKELLQKYSKVYFLNEHYVPKRLTTISKKYTFDKARPEEIHADVWPHLEKLLEDAERRGVMLQIISAFRSFSTQATLKTGYKIVYGTGANQFSAEQGYSEHQLGTAVDFTTASLGSSFENFKTTDGYEWLKKNAYKYGFTLSYPEGNAYYQFEPWHWRFVGTALARKLHRNNEYFYDLDQREINEYLVDIFD